MSKKLAFSVTLDDLETQTFRAGGPGGQNQNKRDTGVRLIHHPSGARGEAREERTQLANKKLAFQKLVKSLPFRIWVHRQLAEGPTPEQIVATQMAPANLVVEYKKDGVWVPADK
jgi:protein subunit release factor A